MGKKKNRKIKSGRFVQTTNNNLKIHKGKIEKGPDL